MDWLRGLLGLPSTAAIEPWEISENGNPTIHVNGCRLTVFSSSGYWKYCVADTDDKLEPIFSDAYSTAEAAKHEALAFARGLPLRLPTVYDERRPAREAAAAASKAARPEHIESELQKFEKLKHSVASLSTRSAKRSTANNLLAALSSRQRIVGELYKEAYADDDDKALVDETLSMFNDYGSLISDVKAYLSDMSDPKEE